MEPTLWVIFLVNPTSNFSESSDHLEANERLSLMKKAKILKEFLIEHEDDEFAEAFLKRNDVGFPLARFIDSGVATPLPKAYKYINETYAMLLDVLEVSEQDALDLVNLQELVAIAERSKNDRSLESDKPESL